MTKSVTKIQDKDTRKRLSVVRSKEDPTKYWVVILNPDWSKIKWPKGDPGPQGCPGPEGPSICDAQFSGNDIVFEKTNGCCVVLEDAATCLQWPQWCTWNWICCTVLNADYTLTLQYTNGCCDTTWSIRWAQWPQGCTWNAATVSVWSTTTCPAWCCATVSNSWDCHNAVLNFWIPKGDKWDTWSAATITVGNTCTGAAWTCANVTNTGTSCAAVLDFMIPKGDTWATWNGICCTTCSKVWKTTTVQFDYTNWTDFCFSVQDGQDGQGSWDMLACVYDPCNCARDAFDYDNFYNTPDLTCYQEKLTVWQWINIDASNKITTTFNYGESTTAAATVQKEVSIPGITELNVWQVVIVKPTVTSTVANSTLKVNNFAAYAMLYNGTAITTSTDSVVWAANVPSMFILDDVSGTKYWRFLWHWLDSNSTYTLNRLIDPSRYHVWTGTYAFSRYSLVMEKADWTWEKITNTSAAYSTWTSKTVNTNWFRLGHIRYYNTTTNLANWALVASNAIDIQAPSVTAAYSFNCGTAPWWAVWTPIYLVGSMWVDWLFYLDTTQRWSTTLPGANDWKLYIRLWTALSADNSNFSLIAEKPVFYYNNWLKVYQVADNKQNVISDLDTIRAWAACWASALQSISCGDVTTALWYTPYSAANPCGYTTCIWTVVAGDLTPYAKSCDLCTVATTGKYCDLTWTPTIPTDNCQLANGCWFTTCTGTISNCAWIISALWYTPYSSANPNWYTSCTGTVVASDLTPYAKSCDLCAVATSGKYCDLSGRVTDNCQIWNGCGYTTCTGTLIPSNIACINGCCLTNGGNICIQWWQDYSWVTKTISWWQVELWLRTIVNVPTSDFMLVKPATLIDWEEYTIRVISETSYCMCLWSCFKNPWEVNTCLSEYATDQYVFLSIGWELELQPLIS